MPCMYVSCCCCCCCDDVIVCCCVQVYDRELDEDYGKENWAVPEREAEKASDEKLTKA